MKLRKNTKTILWVAVTAAVIAVAAYFIVNEKYLPPNFTEARNNSAVIAQEIVSLTEESLKRLDDISLYDRRGNFQKAIQLVRQELERAKESRLKAIDLTKQIETMTIAANEISPSKPRNLGIEAISQELALVTHLIVYNDTLNALLQTLEFKFSGDIRYDADDVQKLVKSMNEEAKEINSLNDSFNEKMGQLDALFK